MADIKVIFKSDINTITLLCVLYDLLENSKPGKNMEDCGIITTDNYLWLLDEVIGFAPPIMDIKIHTNGDMKSYDDIEPPLLRQIIELAKERHSYGEH